MRFCETILYFGDTTSLWPDGFNGDFQFGNSKSTLCLGIWSQLHTIMWCFYIVRLCLVYMICTVTYRDIIYCIRMVNVSFTLSASGLRQEVVPCEPRRLIHETGGRRLWCSRVGHHGRGKAEEWALKGGLWKKTHVIKVINVCV